MVCMHTNHRFQTHGLANFCGMFGNQRKKLKLENTRENHGFGQNLAHARVLKPWF